MGLSTSPTVHTADAQQLIIPSGASAANGQVIAWDAATKRGKWATPAAGGDGGGAGGFGGFGSRIAVPATFTKQTTNGGVDSRVLMSGYTLSNYRAAQPGPALAVDDAFFAICPQDAGWYQVRIFVYCGFSGTLPTILRLEFNTYNDFDGTDVEWPVLAPLSGGSSPRIVTGVQQQVTTHPFYHPGRAVAGEQSIIPALIYNGLGTMTSPTGGATPRVVMDWSRLG